MGRFAPAIAVVLASQLAPAQVVAEALFLDDFESGDYCGWSQNPQPLLVVEGEGNGQGLNDLIEDATAISRCATVEGVIGGIVAGAADFDFYSLAIDRPTLLRVTLASRDGASDFVPYVDVDDDDLYPPLGLSPYTLSSSTTRQIWLPAAGTWYLFVSHADNWDRVVYGTVEPPVAGGASSTYRLTVDVDTIGAGFAVAGQLQGLELPANAALPAFHFYAGQTDALQSAEVTAERLATASPLDAKLYLVRDPVTAPTTIAACDDQYDGGNCVDGSLVSVDPRLDTVALTAVPHVLLVDFFDVYDPATGDPETLPAPFDLALQFFAFEP